MDSTQVRAKIKEVFANNPTAPQLYKLSSEFGWAFTQEQWAIYNKLHQEHQIANHNKRPPASDL